MKRETNTVVTAVFEPGSAKVPDCVTTGPRTSETTSYPDGTSDYSIHTDPRGVRAVTTRTSHDDREVTETQTFSPTNLVNPVILSRNIDYRNGTSITQREWDGQWTRETRLTDYDASGCRIDTQVAESSDHPAVTNNVILCDFLGRAVSTIAPLGIASNFYDGASMRILASTRSGQPPFTTSTTCLASRSEPSSPASLTVRTHPTKRSPARSGAWTDTLAGAVRL